MDLKALKNRLRNLKDLKTRNVKYPCVPHMLDFPILKINNLDELNGRIDELEEILHGN